MAFLYLNDMRSNTHGFLSQTGQTAESQSSDILGPNYPVYSSDTYHFPLLCQLEYVTTTTYRKQMPAPMSQHAREQTLLTANKT